MDQATYDRWWQLHLSVARGEVLESTERATYEAGLAVLDAEERAQFGDASLTVLRNLKAEVDLLEATHAKLQAKSTRLDRQIGTLEGAYMMLTGFSLSGQGHAHLTGLAGTPARPYDAPLDRAGVLASPIK